MALGSDPLEAWRKAFPKVRGKSLGEYGPFLQAEAPDEVNRELRAFLREEAHEGLTGHTCCQEAEGSDVWLK